MKILKRTDIEAIGNRVYAAYRKLPKIAEQRMICAVDPDILLTDLLGLRVDYKHLSIDRRIYGTTSTRAIRIMLCQQDSQEDLYYLDGKTILIEKKQICKKINSWQGSVALPSVTKPVTIFTKCCTRSFTDTTMMKQIRYSIFQESRK